MTAKDSLRVMHYKEKIKKLQSSQKFYEKSGRGGMCIKIQGQIEAYNAVISDLENDRNFLT